MQKAGKYLKSGFTIIELLITISIIGILATLTFVAYIGVQDRAQNAERIAELKAWKNAFETYGAKNGQYPDPGPISSPTNVDSRDGSYGYCLGEGFPGGKCREYQNTPGELTYNESDNAALMNELKTVVANLPKGTRVSVGDHVGPFASFRPAAEGANIHLIAILKSTENKCPSNTITGWYDAGQQLLQCQVQLIRYR